MKKIIKKISSIDKEYFILFFVNLFLFVPLISKRFAYGHDTMYHIAQIDSLTKAFTSFNFTKISSAIANGLGYGSSIFYPKLPHYICTLLNILTGKLNVIYSINLYFIIISFITGIMMYKLIKLITDNKYASLLGSIFYITMPYYISEIYVRCAINEFLILLFIPMIFIGIINLLKDNKKKFYIYFTIGYIGFINSHLVLCVYFTIFLLVFLLINIKKVLKYIKPLIISSIIILIMSLPNIVLLLEHKLTDLYVVFDSELMGLTTKEVQRHGIELVELLFPMRTTVYYFINFIVLIFLVLGIYYITRKDRKNKVLLGIILFTVISILFSLKVFPYNLLPKLLLSIQFPFRNNCFTIFGISIISSYGILLFKNKNYIIYPVVVICLIIACFYINKSDFKDISIEESNYDIYAGIGWNREYLTKNAFNNMEYFLNRDNSIKGDVEELNSTYPSLKFKTDTSTVVEIPRLYYLGYKVREKVNSKYITLDYKCNNNGFIEIDVPYKGIVEVDWIGTPLYNLFRLIRILFIIISGFIILKKHIRN